MPRIMRLYIRTSCVGFAVAAIFVALVLALNIANLRHLVFTSNIGWIAVLAFWILNGIVFAGVQFAFAVSSLPHSENNDS